MAFGNSFSQYPGSGECHARVWSAGSVKKERVELVRQPRRFLGADRQDRLPESNKNLLAFLGRIPEPSRKIATYGAA